MPIVLDTGGPAAGVGPGTAGPPATPPGYIPHFQFPFAFARNPDGSVDVATVEQDTQDEIVACVRAIVACPTGFRDELPAFGIDPPEFAQAPVSAAAIDAQIARWEPRAETHSIEYGDVVSDSYRHVQIDVSGP